MNPSDSFTLRAARWLAFASAVSIMLGIAPSQILLGLALAALMLSGEKIQFPPIKFPLALFWVGTLLALAFSDNPTAGLPQVRTFTIAGVIAAIALAALTAILWPLRRIARIDAATALRHE